MDKSLVPLGDFHIQASPDAAAIRKLVLKHGEGFLVADRLGDLPAFFEGELGFYYEGTRHLRWLELRLEGARPLLLDAQVAPGNDHILVTLTNADLPGRDGRPGVPRNTIHIDRQIACYGPHLFQTLTIASFHDVPCEITLEVIFSADFRDVFEVRGVQRPARGQPLADERHDAAVRLRYRGLDGVVRATTLRFDPAPLLIAAHRAVYRVALAPQAVQRIAFTVSAREPEPVAPTRAGEAVGRLRADADRLPARASRIVTDNEAFNDLLARSLADLEMLFTDTPAGRVPYAGVPWYVAPFGRDALITALELLPYYPAAAAGTLRFLARWQGRRFDPFVDEEPGKILHEYRRGEMANCREIPFIPYYGTVDATPLFLVLLADYVRWTGDLGLARELWPAAQAAAAWMARHGDRDGDGYLEYATRSPLGLANQGWKDSGDAVMHADGTLAKPPIALVEVQGYAYAAWLGLAEVAGLLGEGSVAQDGRRRAAALREAFNRDFWLEPQGFYALALDGDKRPCAVVTSNPGHGLWTGIVDERRAAAVARRLLAEDMFSGWGIRTLAAGESRFNPMSYHNGSVWPHDNVIAAAGFRRYGLTEPALVVANALYEAARAFELGRIPELFCGFPRNPDQGPIRYPVACAPQAWAAGAPFLLLTALLGLRPDAPGRRLTFDNPVLPPWLRVLEITDLQVGSAAVGVVVSRGREGVSVELLGRHDDLELIVRP